VFVELKTTLLELGMTPLVTVTVETAEPVAVQVLEPTKRL